MPHDPINRLRPRALRDGAGRRRRGRVEEELFRLRELLKGNPELLEFLKDPNFSTRADARRSATSFRAASIRWC